MRIRLKVASPDRPDQYLDNSDTEAPGDDGAAVATTATCTAAMDPIQALLQCTASTECLTRRSWIFVTVGPTMLITTVVGDSVLTVKAEKEGTTVLTITLAGTRKVLCQGHSNDHGTALVTRRLSRSDGQQSTDSPKQTEGRREESPCGGSLSLYAGAARRHHKPLMRGPSGNQMQSSFVSPHLWLGFACLADLRSGSPMVACETPAPGVAAPTVSKEIGDISSLADGG